MYGNTQGIRTNPIELFGMVENAAILEPRDHISNDITTGADRVSSGWQQGAYAIERADTQYETMIHKKSSPRIKRTGTSNAIC